MNRHSILQSIERHVAPTEPRLPLSEIVARVAKEIRSEANGGSADSDDATDADGKAVQATVIPIEHIAAFVAGNLEREKVETICRAAMVDNSVISELVAAVRAESSAPETTPPISTELLLRLRAQLPEGSVTQHDLAEMIHEPEARSRRWKSLAIGCAAAALPLAYLGWSMSGESQSGQPSMVEVVTPETSEAQSSAPESSAPESRGLPNSDAATQTDDSDSLSTVDSIVMESQEQSVAPEVIQGAQDAVEVAGTAMPDSELSESSSRADAGKPVVKDALAKQIPERAVEPALFRASSIVGLIAMIGQNASDAGDTTTEPSFGLLGVDQTLRFGQTFGIRSLASSRVSGPLSIGGRMILGEDTDLQFIQSDRPVAAAVQLRWGSVAFSDLPEGSEVDLVSDDQVIGTLRFGLESIALMTAGSDGLMLQLDHVGLITNGQMVLAESVMLTADGSVTQQPGGSPLPEWVTVADDDTETHEGSGTKSRPLGKDALDKTTLAQIQESDDLALGLDGSIRRLAKSRLPQRDEVSTLVAMRVSLAGTDVFELLTSPIESVRQRAAEKIALMPPSDPKYRAVWAAINDAVTDPQLRSLLDRWFQSIRTGQKSSADQIPALIAVLRRPVKEPTDADTPVRGLADTLLRRVFPGAPIYDPSTSNAAINRKIADWYEIQAGDS